MSKIETANSKAQNEAPENFAVAVEALKRGHVIVFPTETLYGLGADALDEVAVEKVFQLKGRDPRNPIPVLVADQEMLHTLIAKVPTVARKLMDRYWPGPLTLVLPGKKNIPKPLCNPAGGVGVRISSQPIAAQLSQTTRSSLNSYQRQPIRQRTGSNSSRGTDVFCRPDRGLRRWWNTDIKERLHGGGSHSGQHKDHPSRRD